MNKELPTTEQLNAAKDCLIRNDAVFPSIEQIENAAHILCGAWVDRLEAACSATEEIIAEDLGIVAWIKKTYEDIKNEI